MYLNYFKDVIDFLFLFMVTLRNLHGSKALAKHTQKLSKKEVLYVNVLIL